MCHELWFVWDMASPTWMCQNWWSKVNLIMLVLCVEGEVNLKDLKDKWSLWAFSGMQIFKDFKIMLLVHWLERKIEQSLFLLALFQLVQFVFIKCPGGWQ